STTASHTYRSTRSCARIDSRSRASCSTSSTRSPDVIAEVPDAGAGAGTDEAGNALIVEVRGSAGRRARSKLHASASRDRWPLQNRDASGGTTWAGDTATLPRVLRAGHRTDIRSV